MLPESLQLEEGTKKLIFILCLPFIDGVFATLLVTGALETFSNIIAIALTVFSGAGALTVLYSYSESVDDAKRMVLKAFPALFAGGLAVALVAPIFEQLFFVERLQYAAGLVLLVIAAQIGGLPKSDAFSTPGVIITGLLLSVKNIGALSFSSEYVLPAVLTVSTAGAALYAASYLRRYDMNMYHIRIGGAAVLTIIGASMFGVQLPSELGLAVFSLSLISSLI